MTTKTLSALAEPNRVRIVELLKTRPYSVNEVAQALGMRQPQASKHLHTLQEAGLLTVRLDAQRHIYALRLEPFVELTAWLTSFEGLWQERLDALDAFVTKLNEGK